MTLLAYSNEGLHSSSKIAKSLNINPVLVRKELSSLKQAGLVNSKEGKNGGVQLGKNANEISMADIFIAAKGEGKVLSFAKNVPDATCIIGQQINAKLETILDNIDQSIVMELHKQTLEEFKNQF